MEKLSIGGFFNAVDQTLNEMEKKKGEIKEISYENILDDWVTNISEASGKGDELLGNIAKRIEKENLPPLQVNLYKRELKCDGQMMPFLIVDDLIYGRAIAVSAMDYGRQLLVAWHYVAKPLLANQFAVEVESEVFHTAIKTKQILSVYGSIETRALRSIVHSAVVESIKKLAADLNLDFSKIDTRTRGFLNIS